jgi:hypothetical protein
MVGGHWIDPAQLARLSPGQIIDRDPVIKSTLSVSQANPGPGGQSLITLQERAPRFIAEWTYDIRVGVLVRMRVSHPTPLATTTGDFHLKQMP